MSARRTFIALWIVTFVLSGPTGCARHRQIVQDEPTPPRDLPHATAKTQERVLAQEIIWPDEAPEPTPEPAPVVTLFVHQVRWPRETLYAIANWYTGSGKNWRRLADANPNIIPQRIRIGDTIRIPESLLMTHQPMPPDFLRPKQSPKTTPRSPHAKPPGKVEEISLYGPVEQDTLPPESKKHPLPVSLETIDD